MCVTMFVHRRVRCVFTFIQSREEADNITYYKIVEFQTECADLTISVLCPMAMVVELIEIPQFCT